MIIFLLKDKQLQNDNALSCLAVLFILSQPMPPVSLLNLFEYKIFSGSLKTKLILTQSKSLFAKHNKGLRSNQVEVRASRKAELNKKHSFSCE